MSIPKVQGKPGKDQMGSERRLTVPGSGAPVRRRLGGLCSSMWDLPERSHQVVGAQTTPRLPARAPTALPRHHRAFRTLPPSTHRAFRTLPPSTHVAFRTQMPGTHRAFRTPPPGTHRAFRTCCPAQQHARSLAAQGDTRCGGREIGLWGDCHMLNRFQEEPGGIGPEGSSLMYPKSSRQRWEK